MLNDFYYNFFVDNFVAAFTFFGAKLDIAALQIVLPVGISFYTFQTLSYSIDVYRRQLKPTDSFIRFSAFVSFFPQLVAGPIERATHLLPQFYERRTFDYNNAADGMRQILWGLFKKVVVADNCATIANEIFANHADYSGSTLVLGAFCFAFQIYGDFSGYSDIAIGCSRLFGFSLMRNFAFPYFSRDIAEFWRRWHISLSTWFRDYLYIPLGGSQGGTWRKVRNTFIIFLVSGFWHGANWTFIVWGALNAFYFLPLLLANKNRTNIGTVAANTSLPSIKELGQLLLTFTLTLLAWVFFRAENMGHALSFLQGICSFSLFSLPTVFDRSVKITLLFVLILLVVEWLQRHKQHGMEFSGHNKSWGSTILRQTWYTVICLLVFMFLGAENSFIYFQF